MKTFEQFDNIDEKEKLFLELAHLNELEIKFDFIDYSNFISHFYKDISLFDQNKKNKIFYINYDKIWSVFEKNFSLKYKEIRGLTSDMIEKHFKLKYYTTNNGRHQYPKTDRETFQIKVLYNCV